VTGLPTRAHEPTSSVSLRDALAYGALRAPLALLELPLFVLLPAFYAQRTSIGLAAIGSVLFLARFIDALADPAIGAALDRQSTPGAARRWILFALPVLAAGFAALFLPPDGVNPTLWLAVASILTCLAWSVVVIAHQTWGARLGHTPADRIRVTSVREGLGLAGVLLAASLLVPERAAWLVGLFALLAALCAAALLKAPLPPPRGAGSRVGEGAGWRVVLGHAPFRRLLAAFLFNGIASAVPATLLLFFVTDTLAAPDQAPTFLVVYFLAAACGMPIWARLAPRIGLRRAWLAGMGLSVLAFVWAFGLGPGDTTAFMVICAATGFALGADLAVPPALLATVLAEPDAPPGRDGAFFGVWSLATKLNLATAAGLALPLLDVLGHEAGTPSWALSFTYALVPCALKLCAGAILIYFSPPSPSSIPRTERP
jgi:Na+/melibiose symporter-like transporter